MPGILERPTCLGLYVCTSEVPLSM